jgi:hypothetical protein
VGVDTHSEAHVGVALDGAGRRLGELVFTNSETGYAEVVRWALGFGAPAENAHRSDQTVPGSAVLAPAT